MGIVQERFNDSSMFSIEFSLSNVEFKISSVDFCPQDARKKMQRKAENKQIIFFFIIELPPKYRN
ncbi:hypothetical protein GCM10008903_29650 [Clostridium cadaveris]